MAGRGEKEKQARERKKGMHLSSPVVFIGYGMELHNPWTTRSTFDYHGQSHYHCSRPKDFLAPSHLYPFFIPLPLFHIFSFV